MLDKSNEIRVPSYRDFLKQELEKRCKLNSRYSLRAFARDLCISPSLLCEVFSEKHGFSKRLANRIATRLGLEGLQKDQFCVLVESEDSRSPRNRKKAKIQLKRLQAMSHENTYHMLELDHFALISDWYHYAILELTYTDNFQNNKRWIAKNLNISESQVAIALERLIRLGLLVEKNEKYFATEDFTTTPDGVPSHAIRSFHSQILQKALAALELQHVSERYFSSTIMAFNQEQLDIIKKRLKQLQREIASFTTKREKKNSVYCLSTQFFRVSS